MASLEEQALSLKVTKKITTNNMNFNKLLLMGFLLMSLGGYAQNISDTNTISKKRTRISLYTGTGTPLRFQNGLYNSTPTHYESEIKIPVLFTYEENRVFPFLPDAVLVGGYARYVRFTSKEEDILGRKVYEKFDWSILGAGIRWKIDIMEAINARKRRLNKKTVGHWINFYTGNQIGLDFILAPEGKKIAISNSNSEETNRDFRFDIFVGFGMNVNERWSFQFELGRTSPAVFTFGGSYTISKL